MNSIVSFAAGEMDGQNYQVPQGVEAIYSMNNANFQRVSLPNSLKRIEAWAFSYCRLLRGIDIPETVEYIGDYAFNSCLALEEVSIGSATPPVLGGDNTFKDAKADFKIGIPGAGVLTYYNPSDYPDWYALRDHFVYYQAATELWYHLVDNEATHIDFGGSDFGANFKMGVQLYGATRDKFSPQVPIPSDLGENNLSFSVYQFDGRITKIPANAFSSEEWNYKLDWMSIPGNITEIGEAAFKNDSKLLVFPLFADYVLTSIGNEAST